MSRVQLIEQSDVPDHGVRAVPIAVVGYGSQGHAHAQNLRDSGAEVVVGLREGSPSADRARADGFEVVSVATAVDGARIVSLLIPDTAQPEVYRREIEPNLAEGAALLFAHGFNIHYGEIDPPAGVDVVLVAPKSPGHMLRREYSEGHGVPALIAVHQDATGRAREVAVSYADGLGSTRAGVIETTFADETETDLFGEQAVLCGGVTALVRSGFETLVEAGYAPELAYFECLHELKLIVDLMYAGGLSGMRERVSDTAEYGDYVAGSRVIGNESKEAMRQLLAEIRSGEFARNWIQEAGDGGEGFRRMRQSERDHEIERVGESLRARMAWL